MAASSKRFLLLFTPYAHQTGFSASLLALEDAGLNPGDVDSERMGVVLGSEMFYCELGELADAYRKCVIDGETGFLVESDDDEEMAAKLSELLNDPEIRKTFLGG